MSRARAGVDIDDFTVSQRALNHDLRALLAANAVCFVDIIDDNAGNPAISELELLEPELWFRRSKEAAEQLALGIKKRYF